MRFQAVSDLNDHGRYGHLSGIPQAGGTHGHRQTALRPGYGPCAVEDVSPHREAVSRRSSSQALHVCRPVSLHGRCPADLPGEPARYRTCVSAQSNKLYHMGLGATVSRSTLADANESRDWRVYAEFAHALIHTARPLYAQDSSGASRLALDIPMSERLLPANYLSSHCHSLALLALQFLRGAGARRSSHGLLIITVGWCLRGPR